MYLSRTQQPFKSNSKNCREEKIVKSFQSFLKFHSKILRKRKKIWMVFYKLYPLRKHPVKIIVQRFQILLLLLLPFFCLNFHLLPQSLNFLCATHQGPSINDVAVLGEVVEGFVTTKFSTKKRDKEEIGIQNDRRHLWKTS